MGNARSSLRVLDGRSLVGCTLRDRGGASEGFVLRICGDTGLLLGRYP